MTTPDGDTNTGGGTGARSGPLGPDDVAALAEQCRRMLDEVAAGRLDADPLDRARIEGAVIALDVVAGCDAGEALARLRGSGR